MKISNLSTLFYGIAILGLFFLSSCYYDQEDYLYPSAPICDTTNIKYNQHIQSILVKNCTNQGCHITGAVFGGFKFDSYSESIKAIPGNKLINAVQYISGGSRNMPPTSKMPACEINQIEAWIRNGNPEN